MCEHISLVQNVARHMRSSVAKAVSKLFFYHTSLENSRPHRFRVSVSRILAW